MLRYEQNICALWLDHMWSGHQSPVNRLLGPHDFPLYLRISGHPGCNYRPFWTIIHVIAMHTGERGIEMAEAVIVTEARDWLRTSLSPDDGMKKWLNSM